jgi:hypothetical protein
MPVYKLVPAITGGLLLAALLWMLLMYLLAHV